MMKIHSPKIVTPYGVSIDRKMCLIMEYVDGRTLEQILKDETVILDLPKILDIAF